VISASIGHWNDEVLRDNDFEDPKGTFRPPELNDEDDIPTAEGNRTDTAFSRLLTTLLEGRIANGGTLFINNGNISIPARTIRQIAC